MLFSRTLTRAGLLIGLMTGSTLAAAPALAAEGDVVPQAALSIRGVDFTSPQAVARVKHQLRRVATKICWADASGRLSMNADERLCYLAAVRDGLTQIDSRARQATRDRAVRLADVSAAGNSAD